MGLVGLNDDDDDMCVSHMAGCRVPDTTPTPEIMYQYAQGEQKGLTATQKKIIRLFYILYINQKILSDYLISLEYQPKKG